MARLSDDPVFDAMDAIAHILAPGGCNSVVECQLPKLDVAGSSPVTRSIFLSRTAGALR